MSKCPHCGNEVPVTKEDMMLVQQALLADKDFMRKLGIEAAKKYLADGGS
jgi:hypothetical protein